MHKKKKEEINLNAFNHWCRVVMDDATLKLVLDLKYSDLSVLEISGEKWKELGFQSYKSMLYPEYDICEKVLDEKFDLIIAEQVFEHLLYPYKAMKNVYSMLNKGGYFLITTPFLIKYHAEPNDCTRWSEAGMKYFMAECGFELDEIKTGSWGNKKCLIENLDEWKEFKKDIHSLENEKDYPMVVWAFAKK
jgi:SAM-dependent methyltransferase